MNIISHFLVTLPVFTIFLSLALGYLLGKLKFGSFNLGATVGVLIVSLLIGQLGVFTRDQLLGSIFFDFFMFAVGYRVGPTFIASMKRFGMKIVVSSFLYLAIAFATAFACFKAFHIGPGVAAGTIAGALTQSAVIGSSLETIQKLPVSGALKSLYTSQVPIVYALTYVFGTIGVLIFLRDIAPKLLHIDIRKQAVKTAKEMDFKAAVSTLTRIRSYEILEGSPFAGQQISSFNGKLQNHVKLLDAKRDGVLLKDDDVLTANDIICLAGYVQDVSTTVSGQGVHEVIDPLMDYKERFFVLGKGFTKQSIEDLRQKNIFVNLMDEATGNMRTVDELKPGDAIGLSGNVKNCKDTLKVAGQWRAAATAINYATFSFGIAFSAALGVVGTKINGVPLALGDGTAALFMGLILSIWQDRHQAISSIPDTVSMFFQSFGLNLFIVTVGLSAARTFTSAFKSLGISVFLIGAIISIVPHIITLYLDKWFLKIEPVALIGSLTGADTLSAGLNAISEKSGPEGAPYYAATVAPAYVIGNIFLTLMGPIFLVLLS